MFPVQIIWSQLEQLHSSHQRGRDGIVLRETHNSAEAAELFVNCFIDQWEWYFERMGYKPNISENEALQKLAHDYVCGADTHFVAMLEDKPVGLNSVKIDSRRTHGELHTGVGVLPIARGRGIGVELVMHALNWLHERGAISAEIRTQQLLAAPNANIKAYIRCGGECINSYNMYRLSIGS